jgi:hypothetical protein
MVAYVALTMVAFAAQARDSADISPAAEGAIRRGLAHMAGAQRTDGTFPESYGDTTGIVAACTLAFLAGGHAPGRGKYGKQVARSVQWMLKVQQSDGVLFRQGMQGHPMYHHGLATLALAEAWGMTQDRRIRSGVQRAIDRILGSQNNKGGWRYYPRVSDDDLSVTVMQLMALRAAKDAGIQVPKNVIDAGIEYVKSCHNGKDSGKNHRDGGFAYRPNGDSGFARTGAGVLSLQIAGDYRAKEVREGIEYLLTFAPVGDQEVKRWPMYGHYYAAQGIYQAQSVGLWGRKAWKAWYPAVTKKLVAEQQPDGRWNGSYGYYASSMALLVLEIPYRYLPIYQR